jgi:hypothetical protein
MPRPINTACPVCGTRLSIPATGRRPRYCSTPCRQAAYRARRRSEDLADRLVWVRGDLADDADRIAGDVDALLELIDQDDPGPGWETQAAEMADSLALDAATLARRAREHARVAAEHERLATDGSSAPPDAVL